MSVYMMLQVKADAKRVRDGSPEIGEMMAEAGVTEQPQVTFWQRLNAPDEF